MAKLTEYDDDRIIVETIHKTPSHKYVAGEELRWKDDYYKEVRRRSFAMMMRDQEAQKKYDNEHRNGYCPCCFTLIPLNGKCDCGYEM